MDKGGNHVLKGMECLGCNWREDKRVEEEEEERLLLLQRLMSSIFALPPLFFVFVFSVERVQLQSHLSFR